MIDSRRKKNTLGYHIILRIFQKNQVFTKISKHKPLNALNVQLRRFNQIVQSAKIYPIIIPKETSEVTKEQFCTYKQV